MQYGLAALFSKQNPDEKRTQITGQMLPHSGLAKPALAYMMGRDMAKGEEWDKNRNAQVDNFITQNTALEKNKQDQNFATQILHRVIEISKHDPVAATQILRKEAESNAALTPFKDISFNANTTKDNWATITGGDGQAYQIYLPGLPDATQDPTAKSKYIIPIGGPKDPKETRTIGNVNPGDYTPESVDKFRGSGNYKDLVPVDKKAGAEAEKSNKEFRGLKGQLESLYGRKASIQKGYDPISGQVIPQTQIDDALRTVNEKIFDAENYMKNTYPEHWGRYKPTIAAPPQSAVDQLKTPPAGPTGAPQSPGKPLDQATASQILSEANGDRDRARQIAKQRGYTF